MRNMKQCRAWAEDVLTALQGELEGLPANTGDHFAIRVSVGGGGYSVSVSVPPDANNTGKLEVIETLVFDTDGKSTYDLPEELGYDDDVRRFWMEGGQLQIQPIATHIKALREHFGQGGAGGASNQDLDSDSVPDLDRSNLPLDFDSDQDVRKKSEGATAARVNYEAKALLIQTAFRGWRARRRLQHEKEWFAFWYFTFGLSSEEETQSFVLGELFKKHGLSPAEFRRRCHFFKRLEFVQVNVMFEGEGGCYGGCGRYWVEIGYPSDFHPTLPIFDRGDTTVALSTETYRLDQFVKSPLEITEIGNEGLMCCSGVSGYVVGKPDWVHYELAFGETRSFTADDLICALRDESPLIFT